MAVIVFNVPARLAKHETLDWDSDEKFANFDAMFSGSWQCSYAKLRDVTKLAVQMMFGLFTKKPAVPARPSACACEPQGRLPTSTPFEEVERLTSPYSHENVSLAQCRSCGKIALYYSADVYDDFWQYWCLIDEVECAILLNPDEGEEPERPSRAREILVRKPTLMRGPVHGFEWCIEGTSVMEGPPW